jgi:GMP synthase-like glutamine amidotransferase
MKPILILQNAAYDWPGYFSDCLTNWAIPFELVNVATGDTLPPSILDYSGFAIMGGGMSVNDTAHYPHFDQAAALLIEARAHRIPIIGHGLGGQLMAKTFGGLVIPAPQHEIGWHAINPLHTSAAYEWFGGLNTITLFQWHNETFLPPSDAQILAGNLYCLNQAFVLDDMHLAVQFHIDALPEKINHWLDNVRDDISQANGMNIHPDDKIRSDNWVYTENAQAVARQLYTRWLTKVAR